MTATEDLFTPIHKGLRSMLYGLSGRLQTNDFADLATTNGLVTDLEYDFAVARSAGCILCTLNHHATDEESEIFPSVAKVESRLVPQLIEEHHELTRRELAIAQRAHALLALGSKEERVDEGTRVNQDFNELFALYLTHMNREETELVPIMQRQFTDDQMVGMRSRIIAQMPPDRLFSILGWMLPSMNVTELATLLSSVRQGAPPPFFQAVTKLCAEKVDAARWSEVTARIGL